MNERPPSGPALALTLLAGVLFALSAWHFAPHQGDDGFIFLRYAQRLASGHGLGFTDGVAPVEGYSSPLWLLLLTGPAALGVDLVVAVKVLSALSVGALLAGVWILVRQLGGSALHAAVAWLALALLRPPMFWAFTGLETPLYAATMVWTAVGLARGRGLWAVGGGVLGVLRPEGPGLAVVTLLLGAFRERRLPRVWEVVAALGPAAVWLVVRLVVYGDVLPNTFYAKAAGAPVAQALRGLAYAGLLTPGLALIAIGWWLGRDAPRQDGDPERDPRAIPAILGLTGTLLAVVIAGGGDWMWFARLLVPILPLTIVLLVTARPGMPRLVSLAAILGLIPHLSPIGTWDDIRSFEPLPMEAFQEGGMTGAEQAAGRWLQAHAEPGALVAINHAGALPYAAPDLRFLDMTGLLDAHIAHEASGGLHERYDVDHVLEQAPAWVVLHTRSPLTAELGVATPDYWVGETALVQDPRFAERYEPAGAAWSWQWVAANTSYTVIYRRR